MRLGNGFRFIPSNPCHLCRVQAECLGHMEEIEPVGAAYCRGCSMSPDAALPCDVNERIRLWEVIDQIKARRHDTRWLRDETVRTAIAEANAAVLDEDRWNARAHGVYQK